MSDEPLLSLVHLWEHQMETGQPHDASIAMVDEPYQDDVREAKCARRAALIRIATK